MASSSPLPSIPVELPFFPIEVWIKIWDFIDFHTLQKKCTIVSKSWFEVIRNTPTLSGEMELKKTIEKEDGTLETLNADGIDSILSHWPMLKVTSLLNAQCKHKEVFSTLVECLYKWHTFISRIYWKLVEIQFKVPIFLVRQIKALIRLFQSWVILLKYAL